MNAEFSQEEEFNSWLQMAVLCCNLGILKNLPVAEQEQLGTNTMSYFLFVYFNLV